MKYIAVLITVHNRKHKTLRCLETLYQQELEDNFIIDTWLTDDGCTDGSNEAIQENFPTVHIVKGDGTLFWNRGMHAAWSAAIKHKDYDYYLWLNDDTYIYQDCVKQLISASEFCDDKSVIVGATCSSSDKNNITYGGRIRGKGIIIPNGKLQEANLLNGNILLIPKFVYLIVGTNDPYFHHAIGDSDYGLRVIKAGLKNYVAPNVIGECDLHEREEPWCDPNVPLVRRWKSLRKPTSIQPEEYFVFANRHYGIVTALSHYFKIHLRCLFPWIWNFHKINETI